MEIASSKRHQTLINMLELDRNRFIDSLVQMNSASCRYQRRLDRFDALDKYDELKKSRQLPLFCHIYENIRIKERERLLGDISFDPVYAFLKEVEKDLEKIADEQYKELKGVDDSDPEDVESWPLADEIDEDFDVYMGSKQSFFRQFDFFYGMSCGKK
jgi:hypothetical protein